MYSNIGGKIKALAVICAGLEALACFVVGVILITMEMSGIGLALMLVGPCFAWISSFFLYGFGEIIDKVCDIEENTRNGQSKTKIKEISEKAEKEAAEAAREKALEEKAKRGRIEKAFQSISIEYVDVICPYCQEELSFEKGTEETQCPFCEGEITIDR